ncbi:hypothetical protein O181_019393 [Austropuccinia psidii MF-1]|uniref:Uncharacterized protein n=1 Tax=Austropuccinia psidii MF-1 TaxID=1389203 RepID=A0A9Q3GTJ7_9BASI|nr:hypothetical protein [Austropuccinia psidii MF-1]
MISQIKLHLTNAQKPKANKEGNQSLHTSEHDFMCGYDFFSSPIELEHFEEGVFHHSDMQLTSRQDAFMETIFDLNSWEETNQQIATGGDILVVNGEVQECAQTAVWDPYNMNI